MSSVGAPVPAITVQSTAAAGRRWVRQVDGRGCQMTPSNSLPDGTPKYCADCDKPYREVQRLPGFVSLCPLCFEAALGGGNRQ